MQRLNRMQACPHVSSDIQQLEVKTGELNAGGLDQD